MADFIILNCSKSPCAINGHEEIPVMSVLERAAKAQAEINNPRPMR
jgi:hypothetical protein